MSNIEEIPSLYPTKDEFEDPITYLSNASIMELASKYGAVKLIPPTDFKPPLSINENKFSFIPRIQKLKELNLMNRCRMMFMKQLRNYNEMKKIKKPKDTFEIIDTMAVYYYDFFNEIVKYYQTEKHILPDISSKRLLKDEKLWIHLENKLKCPINSLKDIYYNKMISYFNYLSTKPQFTSIHEKYPSSLLQSSKEEEEEEEEASDDFHCLICHKDENAPDTLLCDSCDKPYHRYCLSPPLSKIPKDNWYCDNCIIGNGYYGFMDSTHKYSLEDFKNMCQDFDINFFQNNNKPKDIYQLEKNFWNLVNNENSIDWKINYGADIRNNKEGEISGFPTIGYKPRDAVRSEYREYIEHPMNLNNLPFNDKSLLNYLNVDISGMTIPWIYIGSTFSTFCWHVEDQYTLSANYQHFGAMKKWYCIPESNCLKFEKYIQEMAPDLFLKQPDILHQLITLVSPSELIANDIQVYTANQNPGEYIITYPRVYHAGFNTGFNFNEAVNFTTKDWMDYGVQATVDYKETSQKASVFDIYEMMINILKAFIQDQDKIDESLILKCLKYLTAHIEHDFKIKQHIIDEKLITKPIEIYNKSEFNREKFDDDGISCMKCNGFCTFSYIKHFATPYLPTPVTNVDERHSKRLKVLNYQLEILCLDDYLKINKEENDYYLRDEMYVIVDFNFINKLIEDCKVILREKKKRGKLLI